MLRSISLAASGLRARSILLLFFLVAMAAPALRAASPGTASTVGFESVLDRGRQLEAERRWGEALAVYEDVLRERPDDPDLHSRHDLAKLHYDLGRRYQDASFLKALGTLGDANALALYGEVLLKIQSHYVVEPNWQALFERGVTDLRVALGEAAFRQQNLRGKSDEQLAALVGELDRSAQRRAVHTRAEAIESATAVGKALGRHGLTTGAVALEFACAAVGALDEYSTYLTGDQLNDVYSQIEGNFVGLGVELKAVDGALAIVKVIAGSPADRAGIRAGDRILAVDGRSTEKLSTDQAASLLQGAENTKVELTAATPGEPARRVMLKREHVEVPSIDEAYLVDRADGIGYIRLTCFQKTTSRDLDAALWKLHREGMKSLVIDLRGNPGGLLTASVEAADKFVDEGTIVSTRGRSSLEDYNYTAHRAGTWRVPLVVLIDGESASASEIFAGAIRDHRRGTVVGQRSYGKGSVQGIFPLTQAGSGVRLTTARFYSPSGRPISRVGVQPDLVVQTAARPLADGGQVDAGDPVLSAGISAARRQMAQRP